MTKDEYKSYCLKCDLRYGAVGSRATPPYSPVTFLVYRSSDDAPIYTGEVTGSFKTPQEAFRAGHEAARRWIDEHEERGDKK